MPAPALSAPDPLAPARALLGGGRPRAALEALEALHERDAGWYDVAGQAWEALGEAKRALAAFRQGAACRQVPASLYNNLGDLCRRLGLLEEAGTHLARALRLRPHPRILSNYALWHQASGRLGLARAWLGVAWQQAPRDLRLRWNLALVQLALGELENGWRGYEAGLEAGLRRPTPHPAPRWDGRPVTRLHVCAEQGLGDEILFATCLPEARAGCRALTWEADPRLIPLLARSHPGVRFLPRPCESPPPAEARIPQGSLPARFRRRLADFPRRPSLKADTRRVAAWRRRLAALGPGPWIGLSWAGGDGWERRRRRAPAGLWLTLARHPRCRFVDLQYDDHPLRRELRAAGVRRFDDLDAREDLESLAALALALDGVVAVSSATAHLAAAVGARVWLLLPPDPGWRWFGGEASPWYPRMRLLRAGETGWAGVERALAAELDALSAGS